uniref:Uncharacterized protein n=1 Tax=Nelumbo nucifera TaxID=4432 RepID=A0A822YK60_NELNU|nr:TPA_asm: hypothetical protein HUJ06_010206 [Nelumbo nucifera]
MVIGKSGRALPFSGFHLLIRFCSFGYCTDFIEWRSIVTYSPEIALIEQQMGLVNYVESNQTVN